MGSALLCWRGGGERGVSVPFKENNLIVAYLAETVVVKELDLVINFILTLKKYFLLFFGLILHVFFLFSSRLDIDFDGYQ